MADLWRNGGGRLQAGKSKTLKDLFNGKRDIMKLDLDSGWN